LSERKISQKKQTGIYVELFIAMQLLFKFELILT